MNNYREVEYYGVLQDDSNFEVLFEDEEKDFIWTTRDPKLQRTWQEVIDYLIKITGSQIVEVSAI